MLKDLLKEGGLYTLANFLTKGISLLLIPFYTAYFTPADYGVIDLITVFGFFITGVLTLQLSQGLARYVAEPTLSSEEKVSYASSAIWFSFFFLLVSFFVILYFSDWFINVVFNDGKMSVKLFVLAVSSIFLNAVFYFLGVYLRFTRKTKTFSLLSFFHALLTILITSFLVVKHGYGIEAIYISYIIILPILILIQFFILRNKIELKIRAKFLNNLFKYCLPLIPVGVAVVLMSFTDRLFIKYYFTFTDLGVYGLAARFASIIGVVVSGFSMAIGPLILQKHNDKKTKDELSKTFNLFISISTLGVLVLSYFSFETVKIFTTNDNFLSAYKIMPIMYATAVLIGFQMFSPGLMIRKKTGLMAMITICSAGLNVILNLFLIPKFGVLGAALATFIATAIQQIIFFIISQRLYGFKVKTKEIGIVCTVLAILLILLSNISINHYWIFLLIKITVILMYTILLYKLKILDVLRLKNFVRNKLTKTN